MPDQSVMHKFVLFLATAAVVAGCASQKTGPLKPLRPTPSDPGEPVLGPIQTVPGIAAKPQPSPAPTPVPTANRSKAPAASEGRVVEIITRPKLATRPTTTTSNAVARAGEASVDTADIPTPVLKLDTLKRIDTAVGAAPLMRLLAMKLNSIPYQAFAGYGALDFSPALPEGTNPDAMTNDVLSREPGGTDVAIQRLIKGEADLILIPRLPTSTEAETAAAAKVKLRSDLVATEALVFTVNVANPVNELSRDQLTKIFTGQTKTWKDLGEATLPVTAKIAPEPITVAYRARGTGSEELLRQILLVGKPMPELPISKALSSTKLVLDASLEDPETIGFSVFAYATNMKRDGRLKTLAVDGVLPEPSRVASGEYPLTTPIYVLTRAELRSDDALFKLRTWLGSMNGQKVLAEAGYMPVSSEAWTAVRLMGK
ncbi:MAG: phosphate-binding protein [Phycisphaerales bacterium]|nr:phosphate-binding protein [Phycisphaerales bacterium]